MHMPPLSIHTAGRVYTHLQTAHFHKFFQLQRKWYPINHFADYWNVYQIFKVIGPCSLVVYSTPKPQSLV